MKMDTAHNPLHSAVASSDLEKAELLLRKELDIYCKNEEGLTPLHVLIKKRIEIFHLLHEKQNEEYSRPMISEKDSKALEEADAKNEVHPKKHLYAYRKMDQEFRNKFNARKEDSLNAIRKSLEMNERFIKMLLRHKNTDSSTDDIKLLKFYAACTLTKSLAAKIFSDKFSDINYPVNENSSWYPCYTALHFASHCNATTVRVLVKKGANLLKQDVKGTTPLEICSKMFNIREIRFVLSMVPAWKKSLFSDGKTTLMNYLTSMKDSETHKKFLQNMGKNNGIYLSRESTLCPGSTVLHLAVTLLQEPQRQIISDILAQGVDLNTQDSNGSTPIHLAFRQNKLKVLELLLKQYKKPVNLIDKENLSHLHILASVNNQPLIKKIFKNKTLFDIAYKGESLPTVKKGWTPLHTAAFTKHPVVTKIFLENGANLLSRDARGWTAIHHFLGSTLSERAADVLFASDQLRECIVEGIGLTHVHAATWKRNSAINRLIDQGSDVEAIIGKLEDKELQKFVGCRPIHIAMMDRSRPGVFHCLLEKGADMFARRFDEPSPFVQVLTGKYNNYYLEPMVRVIWNSEDWQKKINEKMGITMLHLVCFDLDKVKIEKLLETKIDVNARVKDKSDVWAGYTPLNVLVDASLKLQHDTTSLSLIDDLCSLLISKGADVTLADAEGNTPVLNALKARYIENGNIRASSLMKQQKDFSINPTNNCGMSHFHVACLLSEVETVQKFLEQSSKIDVNQPGSLTECDRVSGHTPLHLALSSRAKKYYDDDSQIIIVNLLLEQDADVHAVDGHGYTPLHKLAACTSTRIALLNKIFIDERDVNKRAVDGKTPLEILLTDGAHTVEVEYFVRRGCQINTYNRESEVGYMALVVTSKKYNKSYETRNIVEIMMSLPDITEVDDNGRNAIHNAVSSSTDGPENVPYGYREYTRLLGRLVFLGCDIQQQDREGRTALHLAVKFQNEEAIKGLLEWGADVNIVDEFDKSPFSYASEFRKDRRSWISADSNASICKILAMHLRKIQLVGLQISDLNAKLLNSVLGTRKDFVTELRRQKEVLYLQLKDASSFKMCSRGFTVRQFLYPTGPVNSYPFLEQTERDSLESFFEPINLVRFTDLSGLLKFQYKNALQRQSLKVPAKEALWELLGFPLPDLCVEVVLMYMTNFDLKNMIAATAMYLDK